MTEEIWQTATSVNGLLSAVQLTSTQELHFQIECLRRTLWDVPCADVPLLLKVIESYCVGRANIELVETVRRRVTAALRHNSGIQNETRRAWQSAADRVLNVSSRTFAKICIELIQLDVFNWVTIFPSGRLERRRLPKPEGYRAVALNAWDDVWAASKRLDSWAGSYNHVRTDARQRVLEVVDGYMNREWAPDLRCIVGNPFRPVAFAPSWRTETAVALAAGIYAERAFDRLPILADALEEAGCDVADVRTHCRGPGPHARGCWVVDGVLGKK
jgi:hypothetical protein